MGCCSSGPQRERTKNVLLNVHSVGNWVRMFRGGGGGGARPSCVSCDFLATVHQRPASLPVALFWAEDDATARATA